MSNQITLTPVIVHRLRKPTWPYSNSTFSSLPYDEVLKQRPLGDIRDPSILRVKGILEGPH